MAGVMSADKRQITVRVDRETFRCMEIRAESMGITVLDYIRWLVYRDTEDVNLTISDLEQIVADKKEYLEKMKLKRKL